MRSDLRNASGALDRRESLAGYGPTLALTVTLAAAAFLVLMPVLITVTHQPVLQVRGVSVVGQSQSAKTVLYLVYLLILPLAVTVVPRLADSIAAGPNAGALASLSAALAGSFAGVLILIRLSHRLPWGDGLGVLLAGEVLWSIVAGACLRRAVHGGAWPALLRWRSAARQVSVGAGVLVFGTILCVTSAGSLNAVPLGLGAVIGLTAGIAGQRFRGLRTGRGAGRAIDVLIVLVLALAIPNLVVFTAGGGVPSIFYPPGVIQNQQDYLLGSANQLLGGGALLVNVPVSQYGVGLVYFLDAWFHLAPIGYGTLGLLDSLLTALFYIVAYGTLRAAGVGRLLAATALAVAVVGLIYGLHYAVGSLPETGPLRFGLPMALVATRVAEVRWPQRAHATTAVALIVVGVAAVWAFEAFVYTVVAFAAVAATQAWLLEPGHRRRWLARQALLLLVACVSAHVLLALATLVGTGHLPDWSQYLAYIRSFLLGGRASTISYDFAPWSPGLAVGAAGLASGAGVLLLVRRAPALARGAPAMLVALAGSTGYAIALLSYVDNRSSTYLLPYIALPLLMAATLWLALLLRWRESVSVARRGAVAFAVAVAVLLVAAAWPVAGGNFSQTALAHAYPGGGLRTALRRLWHPPPIDPRAPEGERLLNRYLPGRRALILLPTVPDLAVEILMRSQRSSSMFIADPIDDGLVPSVWKPKLTAEVARLRVGQRLLIDQDALVVLAGLRAHPEIDPADHPIDEGDQEDEWLLRAIDQRFAIRPIYRDRDGLIVAELASRGG